MTEEQLQVLRDIVAEFRKIRSQVHVQDTN
jgi:hypothetical protein